MSSVDETDETAGEPVDTDGDSGDDLVDAISNRLSSINRTTSSYDQGRAEELEWVLDQINPPEELSDEERQQREVEVAQARGVPTEPIGDPGTVPREDSRDIETEGVADAEAEPLADEEVLDEETADPDEAEVDVVEED